MLTRTYRRIYSRALLTLLAAFFVLTSCNKEVNEFFTLPSSVTVRSFSLEKKDKVLPHLDSVFFSIDLYSRQIFNADSLPYGTKVTALVPVIKTESASAVELIETNADGEEVTHDYLENTTDTIDFSKPVKMRVVSYDGANEALYTITVNVHKVRTDTLVWSRIDGGSLPTNFSAVNAQHTTMSPDGTYYCMATYQNRFAVASTTNPGEKWNIVESQMSFSPDVNTFTATTDGLFILDTTGKMYKSEDSGATWTDTGETAKNIVGAYGSTLLATVYSGSEWSIIEYPSGKVTPAPNGFPVTNTSNATTISFEMSVSNQMLVTGGRTSDGTITSDTWGFDGDNWARISRYGLPENIENMTLVPYFDVQPDTASWRVSEPTTVLLAMFGNTSAGTPNDTVYMSQNFGLTWTKAPESMQLPKSVIPSRTLAQAFPFTGVKYADARSKRLRIPATAKELSIDWNTEYVSEAAMLWQSRASQPIEQWDVPYIYIFGGISPQGSTYNTIYRGAITALTLKPLQ